MQQQESDDLREIRTHEPQYGGPTMGYDEYFAHIMMDLNIRMSSGADELESRVQDCGCPVCQWDGDPPCYYVDIDNDDRKRAGDKLYPWHVQLG